MSCGKCDWQVIHPNGSIGCLQAFSLYDEISKIKKALSDGGCDDFTDAEATVIVGGISYIVKADITTAKFIWDSGGTESNDAKVKLRTLAGTR